MATPQTTENAYAGKRRADFGNDFPEYATPPLDERRLDTGPIAEALGYTSDRLDLIEHKLGDLNGLLMRLGHNLRPVLTGDGEGALSDPPRETSPEDPEAIDRRSTIARRIAALGRRADDLGSIVSYIAAKVEQLDGALELDGVDR